MNCKKETVKAKQASGLLHFESAKIRVWAATFKDAWIRCCRDL